MKIKYVKSDKRNLGFLVWWQSLDGRLEIKYFGKSKDAIIAYKGLKSFGRKPEVWRRLDLKEE